ERLMVDLTANKVSLGLWELGFRPFFLLGTIWGGVALSLWLGALAGRGYSAPIDVFWHAHEMIHGFATAIIVGFLFTASQNWTGVRGVHGRNLKILAGAWMAGRIAFLIPASNALAAAFVDLAFLPIVIGLLGTYLLRAGQ